MFRIADGLLAEHWAVRDDYALVEAIVGRGPLAHPPSATSPIDDPDCHGRVSWQALISAPNRMA